MLEEAAAIGHESITPTIRNPLGTAMALLRPVPESKTAAISEADRDHDRALTKPWRDVPSLRSTSSRDIAASIARSAMRCLDAAAPCAEYTAKALEHAAAMPVGRNQGAHARIPAAATGHARCCCRARPYEADRAGQTSSCASPTVARRTLNELYAARRCASRAALRRGRRRRSDKAIAISTATSAPQVERYRLWHAGASRPDRPARPAACRSQALATIEQAMPLLAKYPGYRHGAWDVAHLVLGRRAARQRPCG